MKSFKELENKYSVEVNNFTSSLDKFYHKVQELKHSMNRDAFSFSYKSLSEREKTILLEENALYDNVGECDYKKYIKWIDNE